MHLLWDQIHTFAPDIDRDSESGQAWIKGMEALMVDFTLASEKAGVMPAVLESLKASYPGMDWENVAKVMMSRVRQHGIRRAAEMREASRMIDELGLDGSLAKAIAERHESFATEGEPYDRAAAAPPVAA